MDKRKMVVQLARDDLVGRLNDQITLFLIQKFQLDISHGRGLFQDAERLDEFSMHSVPPGPGLEILQRTLGLGPPVAVRVNCDFAHSVFFNPSLRHCGTPFVFLPQPPGIPVPAMTSASLAIWLLLIHGCLYIAARNLWTRREYARPPAARER